jgi:DNA polymerase-3 subunit delta
MLVGADDVEKSAVAQEFGSLVEEGLEAFNIDRLYGAETSVDALIHAAQTLPMMSPRRVIIILEAEKLLVPKRESKAAEAEQERLEQFLKAPPAHATIVFVCGPLDQRRRVVKLLLKDGQVVDCGTITDSADAERWVKTRAARDKLPLDAGAVRALVDRAGPDLVRLRSGLERVTLYALGQPSITADDVRQAVPAAPDAQADFGVAKAIWRNDAKSALRELTLALDAGAVPVMMMGQLRAAAEKLPATRLRTAVDAVMRTDLALKSSGGDARVLLERLVVELCGPAQRASGPAYRR